MKIKFNISRKINVSKNVCLWNTWDHEHLEFVHKQFNSAKIIYEDDHVALIKTKVKIPLSPIYLNTLHTLTQVNPNLVLVVDTLPFGIISKLEMHFIEITENSTKLLNKYCLDLPLIFYPFKKIIIKQIKKWNDVNWNEDMPLKLRRHYVLNLGFRDFYGVDKDSKNNKKTILKLPLPRLKDSTLNDE